MRPSPSLRVRFAQVVDQLRAYEGDARSKDYTQPIVTGGKASSGPPAGVMLGLLDGEVPPPLDLSPYYHFRWHLEHEDSHARMLGRLHMAERILEQLRTPRTPTSDQDARNLRAYVRDGSEVADMILTDYVGYANDIIDLIEGLKPGTARRVRATNHCDEFGHPKGVPDWLLDEFELYDELLSVDAVMARYQISRRTVYRLRAKLKERHRAA